MINMELFFTVLGLILAGIGTYSTYNHTKKYYLLLGIMLIIIGQLFAWIATNISNKLSEKRLIEAFDVKISSFEKDVDSLLMSNNISVNVKEDIINETQEVSDWAKKNLADYDSIIIQLEKRIISKKESLLNRNAKWQPIYKEAFKIFEDLANAYNIKHKDSISVKYSESFPNNIYTENLEEFYITVNFFNELVYDTHLQIDEESYYPEQPYVAIQLYKLNSKNELELIKDSYCYFKIFDTKKTLVFYSKDYFNDFPLEKEYNYKDSPLEAVKVLFSEIFNYQIYLLKEKNNN